MPPPSRRRPRPAHPAVRCTNRLAKEQLGVIGIERQALGADGQGVLQVAHHLVRTGRSGRTACDVIESVGASRVRLCRRCSRAAAQSLRSMAIEPRL